MARTACPVSGAVCVATSSRSKHHEHRAASGKVGSKAKVMDECACGNKSLVLVVVVVVGYS